MIRALTCSVLLLAGCVTIDASLRTPKTVNADELKTATEIFYAGTTPADLEGAVEQARKAGPDSAAYHGIAAELAELKADEGSAFNHLFAALQDPTDENAQLHLNQLTRMEWTWGERARAMALLETLAQHHPDADVRDLAKWHLAYLSGIEGRFDERARLMSEINGQLKFAIVGTWDNDSGKGYEAELAPETKSSLDETYEGRGHPLKWRTEVPIDPRGRVDFSALVYPTRWSVAFAQSTYNAPKEGTYRLKLTTSDPVKVWVDKKEVLALSSVEHSVLDQFQVDLPLKAGPHQVLVKSAHQEDSWSLMARITEAQGELRDVRGTGTPSTCAAFAYRADWVHMGLGGRHAVKTSDEYLEKCPGSVVALVDLNEALWFNQERGRTADLLSALDAKLGDQLAFVRLRQARFHQQQGLRTKARDELLALLSKPAAPREAYELLAEHYKNEGWAEDELTTLKTMHAKFEASPSSMLEQSRTLIRAGHREAGLATLHDVLDRLPYLGDALKRESDLELEAGRFDRAEASLRKRLRSWPTDYTAQVELAEVLRKQDRVVESKQQLNQAMALSPDSAGAHQALGNLAYETGDKDGAVKSWREALELNPDDERLANRLDFVAPEKKGPWAADVPSEEALADAVKLRGKIKPLPGADVAYLLDHEVTQLNSDGSTVNVVSLVIHAFNPQGRDRLLRQNLAGSGRVRIVTAYSIDEQGRRSEASSERNRAVLFRGLQPNSTIVLQYRLDAPPSGYLSRYLTKSWSFQGVGDQRVKSQFVFWEPLGTQLHEERIGAVDRREEKRGDQLRITWSATGMPPLVSEPSMPTVQELAANIKISTVPDWGVWLSWERALLDGAFRSSPELDEVAKKLGEGPQDPKSKLDRVHQYVMDEIRYQQDYETFIAGVKPHPAPMTLERRYGDCKDKAVLFITLAEKLGVHADFALVRTRDAGPVESDVPMQQFNHAIVYVPEQPGVVARFYDPTADALDLEVVRPDDVGTRSLVFDPKTGDHKWREIPFQDPALNSEEYRLDLKLDPQGGAAGTMKMAGRGRSGSGMRRTARNAEYTSQYVQRIAAALVPGSTAGDVELLEVKKLDVPATLQAPLKVNTLGRTEGDTLRLKLPNDWSPHSTFSLANRRHPLLFGTPSEYLLHTSLALPEGFSLKKAPQSGTVDTQCLFFERKVTPSADGKSLAVDQTVRFKCERISEKEYGKYRDQSEAITRLIDDELVLAPTPSAKLPLAKAKASR